MRYLFHRTKARRFCDWLQADPDRLPALFALCAIVWLVARDLLA